jgi:predicted PurR-regulated permease PerM
VRDVADALHPDRPPAAVHFRSPAARLLAVLAGVFVLRQAAPLLVPVLLSLLFAAALEPAVARLMRWRLPRVASAVLVCTAVSLVVGASARRVGDEAASFAAELPHAVAVIHQAVASARGPQRAAPGPVEQAQRATTALARTAVPVPPSPSGVTRVQIVSPPFDLRLLALDATGGVMTAAADAGMIALLTFLLLATGDLYKRKLLKLSGPSLERRRVTLDVVRAVDRQIERYLLVRLFISAVVAAATGFGLWTLGVHHAVAWGVVAGVLNVLPYVGPIVAIVLVGVAAFVQFRAVGQALAAAGIASGVAALEGNVLTPALTGLAGELNTVAVYVGVLFWGWLWSVWGMLLAVPLLVAIKALADRVEGFQAIGELLGR